MRDKLPPPDQWPDFLPLPGVVYPDHLNASVALLDENVHQGRGQRVAIYWERQAITYGQLLDQVARFAASLLEAGIRPGDRVLLRLPNRPEFVIAWLSILRIGAIAVATMPLLRSRELITILDDCRPRLAICQDELLEELERAVSASSGVTLLVVGSTNGRHARFEDWLNRAPSAQPANTRADDIALLAYTSGSTGIPKGTIHFHRDVLAIADTYSKHILRPTPDDVFGGHPTLAFTFGLGGLLIFPFRAGASTVLLERFTPERLLQAIRDYRISIVFCAPTTYKMLLRDFGERLPEYLASLRIGVSAGETLPATVFSEWKQRTGITLLDGIGSTEMLHIFISNSLEEAVPGSTGRVVPGYEAKVVDQELNEAPAGTPGLLAVRGPTGCRYWNRPDKQAEYVRGGWNFPGDMFVQDEQGLFHYVCRADDLIICAGNNIAGPEVEAVLLQHAAVKDVAVVASPDELKGFVPKAFVVLAEGWQPDDQLVKELQEFVKQQIAPYKYPRRIEFVEQLPRTQTGKIRRVELRQLELDRWRQHET
ncbi:MAG: benzoate-CoA ligase family protein [Acidobacteriota bacterium]|nr:benzoate-CoA ligase family protein [Blastocatellia bacterium]MDW8238167.1 benzoate-CoA ligase family protein [Acidobacteriota bacterium]